MAGFLSQQTTPRSTSGCLRIFCDANLCSAFAQGEDIHLHTASQVFDVPESAVTPEMRKRAKTINFGIIYGISPYGLSRQLGISGEEAHQYIERYMERFPGIRDYRDRVIEAASATAM